MSNKIREYIVVKDEHNHPSLEEVGCYDYQGDLQYTDDVFTMLSETFKMGVLCTEVSYIIAFDHAKKPKGICKIGQGDANTTPTSISNICTFLLLTGANACILSHNHISDMPQPSDEDRLVTTTMKCVCKLFNVEFIGHLITNPEGYIIIGGTTDGTSRKFDEDGELENYDYEKGCFYYYEEDEDEYCDEEDEEEALEDTDSIRYKCAVINDSFDTLFDVDQMMKEGGLL